MRVTSMHFAWRPSCATPTRRCWPRFCRATTCGRCSTGCARSASCNGTARAAAARAGARGARGRHHVARPAAPDALRAAACSHFYARIAATNGRERLITRRRCCTCCATPHKEKFFDWSALDVHRVEPAQRPTNPEWLGWPRRPRATLRAVAGPLVAAPARRLPVVLEPAGGCDGFLLMLRLPPTRRRRTRRSGRGRGAALRRATPAAVRLRRAGGAAPVDARAAASGVSAAINLTAMHVVTHLLTHPEAAWSWSTWPTRFWQPHFEAVLRPRAAGRLRSRAGTSAPSCTTGAPSRRPPGSSASAGRCPLRLTQRGRARGPGGVLEAVRQALRDFPDRGPCAKAARQCWRGRRRLERRTARAPARGPSALPRIRAIASSRTRSGTPTSSRCTSRSRWPQNSASVATYRYRLQQGIERIAAALPPSDIPARAQRYFSSAIDQRLRWSGAVRSYAGSDFVGAAMPILFRATRRRFLLARRPAAHGRCWRADGARPLRVIVPFRPVVPLTGAARTRAALEQRSGQMLLIEHSRAPPAASAPRRYGAPARRPHAAVRAGDVLVNNTAMFRGLATTRGATSGRWP